MRIPVQQDERGSYLTVGLAQADDVRGALSRAGLAFAEEGDEDCGCGGPVVAVFRLARPVQSEQLELEP